MMLIDQNAQGLMKANTKAMTALGALVQVLGGIVTYGGAVDSALPNGSKAKLYIGAAVVIAGAILTVLGRAPQVPNAPSFPATGPAVPHS